MIGTHPHADHIGGLPDVIRAFAVKTLYSPVDEFEGKPFEAMKRAADAKNVRITVPQAGQRIAEVAADFRHAGFGLEELHALHDDAVGSCLRDARDVLHNVMEHLGHIRLQGNILP